MGKVTQQNSANAEQSAAASAEMRAHAGQMEEFVASLMVLPGGKGKNVRPGPGAGPERQIEKLFPLAGSGMTPANSSESPIWEKALRRANPLDGVLPEGGNFKAF
jgi:methyl-accepting chemotaxis protein